MSRRKNKKSVRKKKPEKEQGKKLVVIIDEEARGNLKHMGFRWFSDGKERKDRLYNLETPLGNVKRVKGTLVETHNLDEHSAEYLYLEVTAACQMRCKHCGIRSDLEGPRNGKLIDDSARYITNEFVEKLAETIKKHPFGTFTRNIFFGGGEPLISPRKSEKILRKLAKIESTRQIVTTNGCNLPLDKDGFAELMERLGEPYIMLSCSPAHARQYRILAREGKNPSYIPEGVSAEKTLHEKARIVGEYCRELGIGFTVNVVEHDNNLSRDLRSYILQCASRVPNIITTTPNGRRDPCSGGQELAIRSNGRMYPHCYDVFNGENYIGLVGLVEDKKRK